MTTGGEVSEATCGHETGTGASKWSGFGKEGATGADLVWLGLRSVEFFRQMSSAALLAMLEKPVLAKARGKIGIILLPSFVHV